MSQPIPSPLLFATQFAQHKSGPLTAELAQNLYLEQAPKGSKYPYILLGTPGLDLFASIGDGPIRGMIAMGAYVWAVSGTQLYRIDINGNTLACGEVNGIGHVSMAHNGTHLWIGTTESLYAANASEILELMTVPICGVTYQDGYLIAAEANSQIWWIGTIDDATQIPVDFSSADAFSDNLTGLFSFHRELYLLKEKSIETWYNSGAQDFPFSRTQVIERGVISGASVAKAQSFLFFLGDDLKVYRMSSYSPEVISTHTISHVIDQRTSPQTAAGFCYEQEGHLFYVLSFSDKTLVYDNSTNLWHVRETKNQDRWQAEWHAWMPIWGKHIVGDFEEGNVYVLDLETYTDNEVEIQRRAISQPVFANGSRVLIDELFIDMDAGVGLVGEDDPIIGLDWSYDGGRTWSNELWRSFGGTGEYTVQPRWLRLGAYRDRSFRLTITAPVPVRIMGAYIRMEQLAV